MHDSLESLPLLLLHCWHRCMANANAGKEDMQTAGMERAPIGDGSANSEPRRRSVPGSKKNDDSSVDLVASTSRVEEAAPFRHGHTTWYGKLVKREGPLLGLLATGTGMVVLNQYVADQVSQYIQS